MSEWVKVKISYLGQVVGGATPSTSIEEYYNGNIPWITPKDLSNFSGRYISHGERNITQEGMDSCSVQLLPKNSVLFSSRAPIGYVAIAQNELCTNQGFKSVIPNDNTDHLFLYYLLKYNKNAIESMGSGTTFKEVSGSTMRNIEVYVPKSKEEQKKIASILGALDDKIELNERINKNLEEQAQALFKQTFIDNPDSSSWQVGTFNDIIETMIAGDWGKDASSGSNTEMVYCIRGADIPEVKAGSKGEMPTRYILPKNYAAKRLRPGDVVVEISGGSPTQSTGRIAAISQSLLDRYDKGMICTNFCKALKPKSGYSMFVYYYWQYLYSKNVFFAYENGTTGIKNLDINGFIVTEPIVLPPLDVVQGFETTCKSVFDTIFANGLVNERLSNIRDALLPKLLSGEIDISDVNI